MDYIPNTFDGKLTLLSGAQKGEVWGIQSWNTYRQKPEGEVVFEAAKDITFWIPTYQYFLEFPRRIQQATALAYAGEKTIDGIACVGVLASWGETAPQKEIDQYLIWIDKENKQLVKLEYTVREQYGFLTGAARYKDYETYHGLLVPSVMPVESNLLRKGLLHEMRILDFQADEVTVESLRPGKDIPEGGDFEYSCLK